MVQQVPKRWNIVIIYLSRYLNFQHFYENKYTRKLIRLTYSITSNFKNLSMIFQKMFSLKEMKFWTYSEFCTYSRTLVNIYIVLCFVQIDNM